MVLARLRATEVVTLRWRRLSDMMIGLERDLWTGGVHRDPGIAPAIRLIAGTRVILAMNQYSEAASWPHLGAFGAWSGSV